MLKRAQVKVEVQVKIERSIETEPTGGAQGGVALAAAGGSGFVCFLCQDSMPAPDIGDGPDLGCLILMRACPAAASVWPCMGVIRRYMLNNSHIF